MNCFNIRELQGILKRRFFTDLVNSADYRDVMDSSMIGLRYKTNNNLSLGHDSSSFYNFGTTTSSKFRTSELLNSYSLSSTSFTMLDKASSYNLFSFGSMHASLLNLSLVISSMYTMLLSFNPMSLLSLFNLSNLTLLFSTLSSNFNLSYVTHFNYSLSSMDTKNNLTTYSSSKSINTPQDSIYSNLESSSDVRYNKFSNPVVSYDYKCGHYLGI